MAASVSRTSTAFLRNFCRKSTINSLSKPTSSTTTRSNFVFQQTRIPTLPSPTRLRREALLLSSMLPLHSATASACLVSKLPTDVSTEGRFANYISPI